MESFGRITGPGGYARIVIIINSSHCHFSPPKTGAAMAVPAAPMAPVMLCQLRWRFNERIDGATIGSPVSPVVADLYMELFEDMALGSTPVTVWVWKRYVDDPFCIVKRGTEGKLLHHHNCVCCAIKLTMEVQKDGALPFLDTLLQRKEDGSLDIMVY